LYAYNVPVENIDETKKQNPIMEYENISKTVKITKPFVSVSMASSCVEVNLV